MGADNPLCDRLYCTGFCALNITCHEIAVLIKLPSPSTQIMEGGKLMTDLLKNITAIENRITVDSG
jgi:hypothetical protein